MTITSQQICWLAALYEGEGCFSCIDSPRMQLKMTDEDVVVKARSLVKPDAKITIIPSRVAGRKIQYAFYVHGSLAISWMMTLYSLLGRRRREKIREIIVQWKNMPNRGKCADYCAKGHPLLIEGQDYRLYETKTGSIAKYCKTCESEYYKKRNKALPDPIKLIAKHRGISIEEATKIYNESMGIH